MQDDQKNNTNEAPEKMKAPAEQLLAMLRSSEAAIFIELSETGTLVIRCVTTRGDFIPEQDPVHAYVGAVKGEHDYLMDVVNGRYNDAARYRALRDFGVLANTDAARFEIVNGMLHAYEESENLADENQRTEEDFAKIANFLCHALTETAPAEPTEHDKERIAAAEEKRDRKAGLRLVGSNGQPLH